MFRILGKKRLLPADFDARAYIAANPDLALALARGHIQSPESHFLKHGRLENRRYTASAIMPGASEAYNGGASPEGNASASGNNKRPLAVVTMVYNDKYFVPTWLKHYGRQAGIENCYIIDHGSDDGSTVGLSAHVVPIPRFSNDEQARSHAAMHFAAFLLRYYDRVLFTDVDEIVVADPRMASDLTAYARRPDVPPVVTVFGMDLVQDEAFEEAIDFEAPILLRQRTWTRPYSALCKPLFVDRLVGWQGGFHFSEHQPVFHGLYMFHLAYVDYAIIERRQRKRNTVIFVGSSGGHHQIPPDIMLDHIRRDYILKSRLIVDLSEDCLFTHAFMSAVKAEFPRWDRVHAGALWRIPERFRAAF